MWSTTGLVLLLVKVMSYSTTYCPFENYRFEEIMELLRELSGHGEGVHSFAMGNCVNLSEITGLSYSTQLRVRKNVGDPNSLNMHNNYMGRVIPWFKGLEF